MKQGNAILDGAIVLVMLFAVTITVFFTFSISSSINTDIQIDRDFGNTSKTIIATTTNVYNNYWDYGIPFILFIFWALSLVMAAQQDINPVFFAFSIIGIIVVLIAAISLESYYDDLLTDSDYDNFDVLFPKTNFILNHLVAVIVVICFSIAGVTYARF